MRINYNVSAMISNNALHKSEDALSKSLERLSSGLKINHAKDNPAGLAMAKRMNAQLEGLSQSTQNAANGISVIETADGAMSEMHAILQRMNELAVKARNGVQTDEDRETIQDEVSQLKAELERIRNDTEFNGQKLLNGEFELKGYTSEKEIKVNSYSDTVAAAVYAFDSLTVTKDAEGNVTSVAMAAAVPSELPADAAVDGNSIKDNKVTIKGTNSFELELDLSACPAGTTTTYSDLEVDLTGIGAMRLQVGANEGQILAIRIPDVSTDNMGIKDLDLSTIEGADAAIESVSRAISYVSAVRSRLGAYQNRLESNMGSQDITVENMTAAYSRIMDVDMAEEMTEYTKNQVLTQAGTSMLAQANERPSQVLQLLQ